ncbi:hypothetical protein HS088_TW13G01105 [Tripterygium wilfordii]|uniref:CTLH domain-containing protein n=1 Tax=Tripterygium wilfordii TaxID=458696 RepID=A0A7J7CW96_TRIWF|nr:uncharacterized protein LOC120011788 [Tripterygium wilfordii]XP_038718840.1 uncharacterized protein LOC120011788 [Tripterygium wilfordii]KAF5738209.1 hypothetical protein HS088_TW13G01105 [Tripterygium wilfordii]
MDSTPVNWECLDALVIDFAKSERLIADSFSPSPVSSPSSLSSSSSYHSRLIIRQVRRALESGDIDTTMDLLRANTPFILEDHRLLFRLQKQKFIELLRRGTAEDRDSAIECSRTSLAPCALDAYAEAYEEFKHVLLAFIYDKDDKTSPVANEWSERRRFDIAGLISYVLRAHLHAYDPVFSLTLRYLISIHKEYCLRKGVSSPIADLTERLLLKESDPPTTLQESLYEAPPFDEVDIQALAHAVELTRQGAIDSLRFAKGDLFMAFQNELSRMKLDVSLLDELVCEYCVYRGIVDSGFALPSGLQTLCAPLNGNQPESKSCLSRNCSLEVSIGSSKHSDVETFISDSHMDSPESNEDMTSLRGSDVELRYATEPTCNHEDCSTSGSNQPEVSSVLSRHRKYGSVERGKRKRWRGRHDDEGTTTQVTGTDLQHEQREFNKHSVLEVNNWENKYECVLEMKELVGRGMAAEVVEEVNALDPNIFVQNLHLLFQLKQVEFLKLVGCGDHSSALRVACSYLGPLAAGNPAFLKPLKETLLAFIQPNEQALGKGLPLNSLATSLQVVVGRRLGIEEPQLMKIMRAILYTHNEWFKLQMCKDKFESLMKIDSLKEVDPPLLAVSGVSNSNADGSSHGSSLVTISPSVRMSEDGCSPTQVSSRDVICDENAILKVMEFLALPRADAIHLLAQYNGNAETVIQQIFA